MHTKMKPPSLKFTKSTVKRRASVPRPRNGGEWSEARFRSFVKGALRGAMWPPKYVCIGLAFKERGINPKTGRKCKLHFCPLCEGLFVATDMCADHIEPVIGPEGFVDWNTFIDRLYKESDGFWALCKECHRKKTNEENTARRLAAKAKGKTNEEPDND